MAKITEKLEKQTKIKMDPIQNRVMATEATKEMQKMFYGGERYEAIVLE